MSNKNKNSSVSILDSDCNHQVILDFSRGEYICTKCGLVISQYYAAPTYKMNPTNDGKSHNSAIQYTSLGDRLHLIDGLGSYIGSENSINFKDSQGNYLSSKSQAKFNKLKCYDMRSRIAKRETDYRVLTILNNVVPKLHLSSKIRDRAAYFYQKITKDKENDDLTNHILLSALCLLQAVREYKDHAPVTIQEIVESFRLLGHRVSERAIIQLSLKIRPKFSNIFSNKIRRSEEYISRIISNILKYPKTKARLIYYKTDPVKYESDLFNETEIVLKSIDVRKRGGRNPYIFAVASIYAADQIISSKQKTHPILTQKILSDAANCAEYSVRDHWRVLLYKIVKKKKIENKNLGKMIDSKLVDNRTNKKE